MLPWEPKLVTHRFRRLDRALYLSRRKDSQDLDMAHRCSTSRRHCLSGSFDGIIRQMGSLKNRSRRISGYFST